MAQTLLLFAGEIAAIVIELLLASLFSATQIEKKKVSKGEISFNSIIIHYSWKIADSGNLGAAKNKKDYSLETAPMINRDLQNMRSSL